MKKLFNEFSISWKFLICFSIFIGLIVGVLNRITLLNNTSFQDIAIWLDMWIILAIFIINNAKSAKEAIIKCFVFFLISQPVIYLIEVLINVCFFDHSFINDLILYFKNYYWGAGWFKWTILTIPGSFIAYQIKKNNILSAIVLSVATCYLGFVGSKGLLNCLINSFPYHLLNSLICLIMSIYLVFIILRGKKVRTLAVILTTLAILLGVIYFFFRMNKAVIATITEDFYNSIIMVDVNVDNPDIVDVTISEDGTYMIASSLNKGTTKVHFYDNDDNEYIYNMSVSSTSFDINLEK